MEVTRSRTWVMASTRSRKSNSPAGIRPSLALPFVYTVTATSGASQSGLDFGNFQLVNVTGNVYNDLNGNGNLDPGEPGLQGWTVILENQYGNTVATTTSDANGNYEFDDLFPGTFIVEEVLQSGWTQTQPVNPNYYEFATQSGLDETGLNFGNFSPGTFTGMVYNDLNGDGTQEPNEPGLAGWTIDLLNQAGTLVATTTSNSTGQYTFTDLAPAVYTIEEIVQSGWYITQPTNPPGTYTVSAQSGEHGNGPEFRELQVRDGQRRHLQRPRRQWPAWLGRAGLGGLDRGSGRQLGRRACVDPH